MAGRNTDCTPEVIIAVADHVREGMSNRDAALLVGVSESAFYGWLARGRNELARVAENPRSKIKQKEQPFVDFVEAIERAIPQRKYALIRRVQRASIGGDEYTEVRVRYGKDGNLLEETRITKETAAEWTAAAWLLERLHPEEFGRRVQAEISGKSGGPIRSESTVIFSNATDDELFDLISGAMGQLAAPPERRNSSGRAGAGTPAAGTDAGTAESSEGG